MRLLTAVSLVRVQQGELHIGHLLQCEIEARSKSTVGFLEKESGRHVRFSITRLRGQAVKTSPFHGGNTGSIPVGVTSDQMSTYMVGKSSIRNICPQGLFGPLAQLVRATGS